MNEVRREVRIAASPEAVWRLSGTIAAVDDWLDTIEILSIEGNVRHMRLDRDRGEMSERVTLIDDDARVIEYEKVGKEGPLRDYRARFWLEADGDGTRVRWESRLEPGEGADGEELAAGIGRAYESGLANLRRMAEEGR